MQTITLVITDESQLLDPSELADFLYLFRATNLALDPIVARADRESSRLPSDAELKAYRLGLVKYSPEKLDHFFDPHTEPNILQIKRISRQSPIEMDLSGWAYLIILGVVLSGGSVSILKGLVHAKLRPLGEGVIPFLTYNRNNELGRSVCLSVEPVVNE